METEKAILSTSVDRLGSAIATFESMPEALGLLPKTVQLSKNELPHMNAELVREALTELGRAIRHLKEAQGFLECALENYN